VSGWAQEGAREHAVGRPLGRRRFLSAAGVRPVQL